MNENNIYIVLKLLSLANTYFCSSRPLIMTSKDFQNKITFTDYKRSADRVTRLGDFISFFLTNFYTKVAKIFKNFLVKTTFKSKLPWLLFGQLLAGKFRATFCLVTSGHTERCWTPFLSCKINFGFVECKQKSSNQSRSSRMHANELSRNARVYAVTSVTSKY